jgi:hypothetical protein
VKVNKLELLLKKERPRAFAYCDMGKPFKYLDEINKEYFCGVFDINKVYDLSLDVYNYFEKNGVFYAKHESLVRTFVMMYELVDKYKKELNVVEEK